MELNVPSNESQIAILLQACESDDLEIVARILNAIPELIFDNIPGKDLSFILFMLDAKKVDVVDVSLTALQNSSLLIAPTIQHFIQQEGLCVNNIKSSLDDGSCEMLKVIQRHSSWIFENEEWLLQLMQVALMYSIMKGNLAVVEFILDHYPALLNALLEYQFLGESDRKLLHIIDAHHLLYDREVKYNPLLFATAQGQLEICQALLSRGADVHFRNNSGLQAIHLGCSVVVTENNHATSTANTLKILKLLFQYGADVNSTTYSGRIFPLMCAIDVHSMFDNTDDSIIRYLLQSQGASFLLLDKNICKGYRGSSTVLIENGCPIDYHFSNSYSLSLFEELGYDPALLSSSKVNLFEKAVNDPFLKFRMLCSNGFDWQKVNNELNVIGDDGLYRSLMNACLSSLTELKRQQPQIINGGSISETTQAKSTPDYLDIIYTILDGDLINAHLEGTFFMEFAFNAYKVELEDTLFGILARASVNDFEAKVKAICNNQYLVLHYQNWNLMQCFIEHHNSLTITVIRYLLEQQEVDVDVAFDKIMKQTALMRICEQAIDEYSLSIAECLLDHGAKINLGDKNGKTALHYLVENKSNHEQYESILTLLLQAGADINQPDKRNQSPLALSKAKANKVAARLFRHPPKKRKREDAEEGL